MHVYPCLHRPPFSGLLVKRVSNIGYQHLRVVDGRHACEVDTLLAILTLKLRSPTNMLCFASGNFTIID